MRKIDLNCVALTPELLSRLDPATAHLYGVMPVRERGSKLCLAMAPSELLRVQDDELAAVQTELQFILRREIEWVLADRTQLHDFIAKCYPASG